MCFQFAYVETCTLHTLYLSDIYSIKLLCCLHTLYVRSVIGEPKTAVCRVASDTAAGQLSGLAVLGVGIWSLAAEPHYVLLLSTTPFGTAAYVLVAAGALVLLTSLCGCIGALRESLPCLLKVSFHWPCGQSKLPAVCNKL